MKTEAWVPRSVAAWCGILLAVGAPAERASAQSAPASEPAGVRLWSSDIHDVEERDAGGEAASISMVGARNGAFSGKVVVGSSGPIQGLKAAASDLRQAGAAISAELIRVRYGTEWDGGIRGRLRPKGRDVLLERPPAEVPGGRVAVWLTVRVPKDARPGSYAGELSVEAEGLGVVRVPVKLEVQDWTVPAAQDYRTWVELIQSPDTLAVEYGVPLWSDRHWEMVARSLRLISDTGSRVVYVPLICRTNQGNEETMVRWIRKGENQYANDYTVVEKYLDLVEQNLGRPKLVVFYAWDVLLCPPPASMVEAKETDGAYHKEEKTKLRARIEQSRQGVPVTCLDPVAGKVETVHLPSYSDPASKSLWQPAWKEIRQRMARRGLEGTMMLGMLSDWRPQPQEVALLNEVSGGLPWASCSHHLRSIVDGRTLGKAGNVADIGMAMVALDFDFIINPDKGRSYGWKAPYLRLHCWQFPRFYFNASALSTVRQEMECNITGGQRGIGRIGGDFWPCVRNKAGNRVGIVTDRYPQAYWHSLNVGDFLLAPGPEGPVGTARLEIFREGLQECEARIAIEGVLTDDSLRERIGPELATRAQQMLDTRHRHLWVAKGATEADLQMDDFRSQFWNLWLKKWDGAKGNAWFISSGWQQRTAELFAIAGEVEKKLAAK